MKLYISCPITGIHNYMENFQDAVTLLRWAGFTDVIFSVPGMNVMVL